MSVNIYVYIYINIYVDRRLLDCKDGVHRASSLIASLLLSDAGIDDRSLII